MREKDFIRFINEELGEFDFLNNDKYTEENEINDILKEEFFQRQFIIDSITKKRDKITLSDEDVYVTKIEPDFQKDEHNDLTIEYSTDVEYIFNDKPMNFKLFFGGSNNVNYSTHSSSDSGNYYNEPQSTQYISSLDWSNIPVTLYNKDGDIIEFVGFDKETVEVQNLFIKSYLESIIENRTDYDIVEDTPKYNSPPLY